MTKMIRLVRLALTIGFLLVNCSFLLAQQSARTGVENRLADTQWRLSSLGVSGSDSPVLRGTTITLKFGAAGRASGSSGCNSYGAEYRVQGDSLSFSNIFSTKRACLDRSANQQEQMYLGALEAARQFKLSNDSLRIFNRDEESALNFVRDPPATAAASPPENQCGPVTLLATFYDAVNLNTEDIPKDEGRRLYKARMSPVSAKAKIPKLLADPCRN